MICCSWLARRFNWTMAKRDRKSKSSVAVCCPPVPDESMDVFYFRFVISSAAIDCYHEFEELVHPYCGILHR